MTKPSQPRPVGRPRLDIDQHKELIIKLYQEHTPWAKIEQILLTEHGCKARTRTLMHRFKEWDIGCHSAYTRKNDELMAKIKEYWTDRSTRPKSDDELHQKLVHDGFTISKTAIPRLRRELNLFRRWDEKLGRVRPDSELGRRKRRKQKSSAFTEAQFLLPPDGEDSGHFEDGDTENDPADITQQLDSTPDQTPSAEASDEEEGNMPSQQTAPLLAHTIQSSSQMEQTSSATTHSNVQSKDALIKTLEDRVRLLEQHCFSHGIGLPDTSSNHNLHGLQSLAAAIDMGHWQPNPGFRF